MKKYLIHIIVFLSFIINVNAYLVFGNYDGINVSGGGAVNYGPDTIPGAPGRGTRRATYLNWGGGIF